MVARFSSIVCVMMLGFMGVTSTAQAQAMLGTAFTYQGQLKQGDVPLTGLVDLQFAIWTHETGGSAIATIAHNAVPIDNGLFTVDLDFGDDLLWGDKIRWLEVQVAYPAGAQQGTTLTPRQRIQPTPFAMALPGFWPQQNATSPNLLGGWAGNMVTNGVVGATVSGGGGPGADPQFPDFNAVSDDYGTVSGGKHNHAGNFLPPTDDAVSATVGGGEANAAFARAATIAGGSGNYVNAAYATVAGGKNNQATSLFASVGGGETVKAQGQHAVAAGGWMTLASSAGAVASGGGSFEDGSGAWFGHRNRATGGASTVPGGWGNTASGDFSLAAGHRASAEHTGSFVWADATGAPDFLNAFSSTGPNQFLIRASGGVGIGTNSPQSPLHIAGGNWNLDATEGDFKIGDATARMKFSIALAGGGRGIARIRSQGGANALWLGSGTEDLVFIQNGRVGITTAHPAATLAVGSYDTTPGSSPIVDYSKLVVFGGEYNAGTNAGNAVKLLISQYDNDESDIYPIYAEDENRGVDFYVRNQAGLRTAYFGGSVGIGTQSFTSKLTVNGMVQSLSSGFKFPDGSVQTSAAGGGSGWSLTGNAGTAPRTNFVGTTDNVSFELKVDSQRALFLSPHPDGPSIVGGYESNAVAVGVVGGTIGGGGGKTNVAPQSKSNRVEDNFGTVSGGWDNRAGDGAGTTSDASGATVGGGWSNNAAAMFATIGGGSSNTAGGTGATVPGGADNTADGAYSFAAGRHALAIHEGTFVWADNSGAPFDSTGPAQFLVRAAGGVGIGTNNPGPFQLAVGGNAAKAGGGSWAVYSDKRLKKNISPLGGALRRLLALRGVTFEYKDASAKMAMSGSQIGLIAQEVEKVFPQWVDEDTDGLKYVTVRGLEALLVEALRELQQNQHRDVERLRAETEKLRTRLRRLEGLIQPTAPQRTTGGATEQ